MWKTQIGSAVVTLPWAFQQSGVLLGCTISFTSFIASYYTCQLIVNCAKKDSDFSDTIRRYYGKYYIISLIFDVLGTIGFYIGTIMSALILYGVLIVYFVIQTQLLYPLTLACYAWSTGNDPAYLSEPTFG